MASFPSGRLLMLVRPSPLLLLMLIVFIPFRDAHAQKAGPIILKQLDQDTYQTEHALFIVDTEGRLDWPNWRSILGEDNLLHAAEVLHAHIPDSFMTITVAATNLQPKYVPAYLPYGPVPAKGIGRDWAFYEQDFSIYGEEGDRVTDRALAVFDHEIGHAWGAYLPFAVNGHWPPNSTIWCQMYSGNSGDAYEVLRRIVGNDVDGFFWRTESNTERNRSQIFSEQQLYVMGLEPRFPDTYILHDAVFNPDSTMSYSSVTKVTHEDVVAMVGPRDPGYRTSPKQFRIAFVFVARSVEEMKSSYEGFETAIRHFTYSQKIPPSFMDLRVPFFVLTKGRASVSSRLADLDGNASPRLAVGEAYASMATMEQVEIPFDASDPDGTPPNVTCLGLHCRVEAGRVVVGPIEQPGTQFYTLHAEDARGKQEYAHFVVDVVAGPLSTEAPSSAAFILHEPYPNPVRTSTTFTVEMGRPGQVTLEVFDVRGRRVALVDDRWHSAGRHRVEWNASTLPSGIYVARLSAGTTSQSRKVAVVR